MSTETLGDVYRLIQETKTRMDIFGATAEFTNRFNKLVREAGEAIMNEQNLTQEQAKKLPLYTKLGEGSLAALSGMKELLESDKKLEQGQ